jgi:hypothetical protein
LLRAARARLFAAVSESSAACKARFDNFDIAYFSFSDHFEATHRRFYQWAYVIGARF